MAELDEMAHGEADAFARGVRYMSLYNGNGFWGLGIPRPRLDLNQGLRKCTPTRKRSAAWPLSYLHKAAFISAGFEPVLRQLDPIHPFRAEN
jgi:hypothetical protein